MEVFETGKNNQQPSSKAEPARPGDGFTPEELYAKGEERRKAGDLSGALMWYEKAAEMQKYEITQSRYEELKKELEDCKTTRTAEVKKRIYEARLLGDLSENEAYDKAKNEERCLCERIKKIEEILQWAVIAEESQN